MERLKLICANMLCSYISDARMAITTLDLADKHGCPRLREACKKFLMHGPLQFGWGKGVAISVLF